MANRINSNSKPIRIQKALAAFSEKGGTLRFIEAKREGIQPRTLKEMMGLGFIVKLSRGIYRLSGLPPLGNPDVSTVAARIPNGVICLISALVHHGITTQVPHEVHLALKKDSEYPRIAHPPIRVYWFSGPAFTEGVQEHRIDGFTVRIYCPEKTVADCFKFRNRIGLDVALEALRLYMERKDASVSRLLEYARICRVESVMRPYLEAML